MSGALPWRRILLTLGAIACLVCAFDLWSFLTVASNSGILTTSTSPDFVDRIHVHAGSPAARAGLRDGDILNRKALSPALRYRLTESFWRRGEHFTIPVERDGRVVTVTITPELRTLSWQVWLAYGGTFWSLVFALVIGARRPDDPEARTLALLLLLNGLGTLLAPNNEITPWPLADLIVACVSAIVAAIGYALLGSYAGLFARPLDPLRRRFGALNWIVALLSAVYGIAGCIGAWTGTLDPSGAFLDNPIVNFTENFVPFVVPLICVALALAVARGAERTRLSWAAAFMAVLYGAGAVATVITAVAPQGADLANIVGNIGIFIAPIGLTYALLNRGLLDIGFALNRAAVFTATTLLFAGLFAALQTLANATLSNLTQTHNLFVQLAIAVMVYYVIRLTRARTDRAITSVFFAQRERQIAAIRDLMVAVDDVSSPHEIAPFAIAYLRSHTTIDAVVLLENDAGDFAPASGSRADAAGLHNDGLTVVTLRSTRAPARAFDWEFPSATAFPMLVRGRLRGVFLVMPQPNGEAPAPDELRALADLASRMAAARDDLLSESLRAEVHALREHNLALQARLASIERS